jgi:hypothetical protein
VDPDPQHYGKLDPGPHQSAKLDPDPHQSEKVEALEDHFGALEGSNQEKVSGRIRIRNNLKRRVCIILPDRYPINPKHMYFLLFSRKFQYAVKK